MIITLKKISLILFLVVFLSCKSQITAISTSKEIPSSIGDTTFVNLKDYSSDFVYDMKYATDDNFLKAKVYDCAECYLRLKTVRALVVANQEFIKKGYRIKLFDCYRPLDIQKKMWEIVPNPEYVADPAKGSIHNRGGAVDITLVNKRGRELDMGTKFDFFGIEASHAYENLSQKVKDNRMLLKSIMLENGFNSFDSEWWHYNLKSALMDVVSNEKWKCN
ncbi:peptidase M15 [Flavobacterium sufflavum]|uniref:D-alanyl-D-alanine dipeptidase n=1 Tax=Flavobacterium sufflavum TaxID=1921138 RepID=A0A3S2U092_9FLAO|nr:M15 family metallopeptidase [Flavobacterium sufflavum]RVT73444.1 peptidase M15 [Flavobacterium sufflavum]